MATFRERKRWVFFGLPFSFTVYTVEEEQLLINMGFLNKKEDTCYLYKVVDVRLESTLFERLFGLGTVICYTGDVTDKVIKLEHIKNSKAIKDYIFAQSEEMRKKRRTLNTLNLNANIDDIDDVDDGVDA